jgi:O-antigen/teichoic acid export membrane protein
MEEIRQTSKRAERYIAMIGLPITILIIMFPYAICEVLLGPLFIDSGDAIWIMAITNFLIMLNAVHGSQIVAVGRPDISARITIFTVIVNISLMLLLIPPQGMGLGFVGAALALLIGNIIGFLLVRYAVWRATGPNERAVSLHLVAGIVTMAAFSPWTSCYPLTFLHPNPLRIVTSRCICRCFALLKEFTRGTSITSEMFNMKKMFSYIAK